MGGACPRGYGTSGVFTENCLRWGSGRGGGQVGTHAQGDCPALPGLGLDQEPLCIGEEGGLREAGGPTVGPLWEAPQGQGWQQGLH